MRWSTHSSTQPGVLQGYLVGSSSPVVPSSVRCERLILGSRSGIERTRPVEISWLPLRTGDTPHRVTDALEVVRDDILDECRDPSTVTQFACSGRADPQPVRPCVDKYQRERRIVELGREEVLCSVVVPLDDANFGESSECCRC